MSFNNENRINNWVRGLAENSLEKFEKEQEFEAYKKTWKIINEMQNIEQFDTDKAWNKLYSKIEEDVVEQEFNVVKKVNFAKVFAYAASIAVFIGIISAYLLNNSFNNITHANESLRAQLVSLPDGTQVFLNSNSEISYAKEFETNSTRNIELKGEAFFDVAKDKSRPFVIKAEHSFIKVLGTSFNVNAKQTNVEVVVKTGKVEVYNENTNYEHVVLLPGDKALISKRSEVIKSSAKQQNYLAWLNKKLVFKAQPLYEVIADLNKAYHSNITIDDDSIANLKITSTFDNDPLDEVLKSISLAFDLKIEKNEKKYTLVSN